MIIWRYRKYGGIEGDLFHTLKFLTGKFKMKVKDSNEHSTEEEIYYNSESEGKDLKEYWQKETNTKTQTETTSN